MKTYVNCQKMDFRNFSAHKWLMDKVSNVTDVG